MKLFRTFLALLISTSAFAQDSVNIIVSNRVNFETDYNKEQVLETYRNYLASIPDSIYDNPYWNQKEKKAFKQFDFSIKFLLQGIGSKNLSQYMDLYVLTIEPSGTERYTLRVQYQFKGGLKSGSSIWCIHKVNAIKEDNKWVLENYFNEATENWKSTNRGLINYHHSPDYKVNGHEANRAANFLDSLKKTFNINKVNHIDYYLTKSADQLGELLGFEYFFTGYTTGVTVAPLGRIYTSVGEFHAHELVHLLLYNQDINRNFFIEEGIASFLGSKFQYPKKYNEEQEKFQNDLIKKPNYTIENIYSSKLPFNSYNYKYAFGARICELVYTKRGIEGLKRMLNTNTVNEEDFFNFLKKELAISSKEDLKQLLIKE